MKPTQGSCVGGPTDKTDRRIIMHLLGEYLSSVGFSRRVSGVCCLPGAHGGGISPHPHHLLPHCRPPVPPNSPPGRGLPLPRAARGPARPVCGAAPATGASPCIPAPLPRLALPLSLSSSPSLAPGPPYSSGAVHRPAGLASRAPPPAPRSAAPP